MQVLCVPKLLIRAMILSSTCSKSSVSELYLQLLDGNAMTKLYHWPFPLDMHAVYVACRNTLTG